MNKIRKLFILVVCLIFFGVTPAYANDSCNHQLVKVSYTWSDDNKTCTASRTCLACPLKEIETVTTTPTLVEEKTCILPELTSYSANFTNTAFVAPKKTVQTEGATGHSYGQASYTWSDDNETCTATRICSVCTDKESETATTTPTLAQEKTCILPELTSYRASFTNTAFVAQEKTVQTEEAAGHSLKKTEGVAASAAKEGNSIYWHCDDCDKYFSDEKAETEITKADTVLEKIAPVIIEGDGASVSAGGKKALSFTSDAAYKDFICVELDGKTVDESNYTVKEGSAITIVTLKEDFVAGLSEGDHSLSIVSTSGEATAKFTVNKKAAASKVTSTTKTQASKTAANPETKTVTSAVTKTAPKTGDGSQMPSYMSLLFASLSLVTGLGIKKKKAK